MDASPLVCICIPNYNNENTISKTLDSLLNQTYKNIVIKVFDNASSDRSLEILRGYESKYENIKIYPLKETIKAEANFTRCIENMEGEFSAIYHSDDLYLPTIVEEEVNCLQDYDVSAVSTLANFIDEHDVKFGESKLPCKLNFVNGFVQLTFQELLKINLKFGNILVCPTMMAKTSYHQEVIKNWDKNNYETATDVDVWLRFAKFKNIGFIDKKLINYRFSNNSVSYRRLRIRDKPLDVFFVLDRYFYDDNNRGLLDLSDIQNYKFLKFRDTVVVERNLILNGIVKPNKLKIWDKDIFSAAFKSRTNLFVYLVGFTLNILNFKSILARLVKMYVEFGKR